MHCTYGTLTDRWKIEIAGHLAIQMGFRGDEVDDVMQDIMPIIAAFRYEPEKSNGATEQTAISAVIRKRLTFLVRCRARRQKHEARYRLLHGSTDQEPITEPCEAGPEHAVGMALDVQEVVARLTPEEQRICAALADGKPLRVVASEVGISRYELDQVIAHIREQFQSYDLDVWIRN